MNRIAGDQSPSSSPCKTGPSNDRQRDFVHYYVVSAKSGADAARRAGYSSPKQDAFRLLRLPHIQQAIREERQRLIDGDMSKLALGALQELVANNSTPAAARVSAAKIVLEMAGYRSSDSKISGRTETRLEEMTVEELQAFIRSHEKPCS